MNRLVSYAETSSDEEDRHPVKSSKRGVNEVATEGTKSASNDENESINLPITDESDGENFDSVSTDSQHNNVSDSLFIIRQSHRLDDSDSVETKLAKNAEVYPMNTHSDDKLTGDNMHGVVLNSSHREITGTDGLQEQESHTSLLKDSSTAQNVESFQISCSSIQRQSNVEGNHKSEELVPRSTPRPQLDRSSYLTSQRKRKLSNSSDKVLHVPDSVQCMYHDRQPGWVDNPAEHDNRIRSFPHLEGNWATHVYIPVKKSEVFGTFVDRLLRLLVPPTFHAMPDFHVSLSRTVTIRYHWIEPLVDSLRENLKTLKSCFSELMAVKLFTNDEKTRTFVVLELSQDDREFLDYVRAVDKSFAEFKLPPYYENPSFHISVGWCLGDATEVIPEEKLTNAKEVFGEFMAANPDLSVLYISQICCQTGSKSFVIKLEDSDK